MHKRNKYDVLDLPKGSRFYLHFSIGLIDLPLYICINVSTTTLSNVLFIYFHYNVKRPSRHPIYIGDIINIDNLSFLLNSLYIHDKSIALPIPLTIQLM